MVGSFDLTTKWNGEVSTDPHPRLEDGIGGTLVKVIFSPVVKWCETMESPPQPLISVSRNDPKSLSP